MMDLQETQEFRSLDTKSTTQIVTDDEDEMVLNYSDSDDDDRSSKISRSEFKDALEFLGKDNELETITEDDLCKTGNNAVSSENTSCENIKLIENQEICLTDSNNEKSDLLDRLLTNESDVNDKVDSISVEPLANEIDENALLDEITNDLDKSQDELDDDCILEDDLLQIMKDGKTDTEDPSIKNVTEKCKENGQDGIVKGIAENIRKDEIQEETETPYEYGETSEISIETSSEHVDETFTSSKMNKTQPIELDAVNKHFTEDNNDIVHDAKSNLIEKDDALSTNISVEQVNECKVSDLNTESDKNDVKRDEDCDNNLLEEMADSPRSAENDSSTVDCDNVSEMEKEFPDDVTDMELKSNIQSSNENSCDGNDENVHLNQEITEKDESENGVNLENENSDDVAFHKSSVNQSVSIDESDISADISDDQTTIKTNKRKTQIDIDEPEVKRGCFEETLNTNNTAEDKLSKSLDEIQQTEANDSTQHIQTDDVDDDVLIVGEIKQSEDAMSHDTSNDSKIDEPVKKAKILILDTKAIENDLGEKSAKEPLENIEPVKSPTKTEQTKETSEKPVRKENEPLTLNPQPQKLLSAKSFSLNFVRRFRKNFDKMNRNDLEELVLEKCIEAIMHKSEEADMRHRIELLENKLSSARTRCQELSKQYRDLEMILERANKDLETKNQTFVTPVKITRAVGLQVSLPRKDIPIQKTPTQSPTYGPNFAQQNAAMLKNRRKPPTQQNLIGQHQQQQQQQLQHQQQLQQQQQIQRQNMMTRKSEQQIQQQRAQFHLQQQQAQAQNQNNLLKQQLIQNNPQAFKQQQQQPSNIRKPVGAQYSPLAKQMPNANSKPPGAQRVPPVILKKMSPQTRLPNSTGTSPNAMYVNQSKLPNARPSAGCIDLTDEDDKRMAMQNGTNPPALVAIPNQMNKVNIGQNKLTYVQVKQPSPQTQMQNRMVQKVGSNFVYIAPKANVSGEQQIVLRKQQQPQLNSIPRRHPAPPPFESNPPSSPYWKQVPPRPVIQIRNADSGIIVQWNMDDTTDEHAEVISYQIYAYQETSAPPSTATWKHVGDVKAMLLPMAVTLTQFQEGQRYHFAVRAVDEHNRKSVFSIPRTWT